jgi:hypothetical protein
MNFKEFMAERVLRLFLNECRVKAHEINHERTRTYATDVRNDIIPERESVIDLCYTERTSGTPYVVYGD